MASIKKRSILDAIKRYYKTLSYIGSISQNECYKILVSLFLNDLVNSDLSFFVTEEDYDKIGRLYRNMLGGCIMPYDQFCVERSQIGSPLLHVEGMGITRITEDNGDYRFVDFSNGNRIIENLTWVQDNGL